MPALRLKTFAVCCSLLAGSICFGQKNPNAAIMDTTIYDYDEIFSELDLLIDSLYTPRSFGMFTIGAGNGYFNYLSAGDTQPETKQQSILSPSLGYFSKNGLGLNASASMINYGSGLQPFQYSLTGSYDYLQKRSFITGISATHFFTKEDLPIYTSPLSNELYGYFTYRKSWVKPSISASYGWGSRESVQEQQTIIDKIKDKVKNNSNGNGNGGGNSGSGSTGGTTTTVTTTNERVMDFNLTASLRHDFFLMNVLSAHDYIRLTPQVSFTSGTQQFGFNSTSTSYLTLKRTGKTTISNTKNIALDDKLSFRPLSLTTQLRTEYARGKFFLQPQLLFDYYFPANEKNLTTSFFVNAGFIF